MNKHRYAIRLSEAEAIKLYEKDMEKLQKQSDLLTLGILQEKNKITVLEKKVKALSYRKCTGCGNPIDVDYCTTCRKDLES